MITMRETRILEFKETITNTFLKTVSAFSNYNGGSDKCSQKALAFYKGSC